MFQSKHVIPLCLRCHFRNPPLVIWYVTPLYYIIVVMYLHVILLTQHLMEITLINNNSMYYYILISISLSLLISLTMQLVEITLTRVGFTANFVILIITDQPWIAFPLCSKFNVSRYFMTQWHH